LLLPPQTFSPVPVVHQSSAYGCSSRCLLSSALQSRLQQQYTTGHNESTTFMLFCKHYNEVTTFKHIITADCVVVYTTKLPYTNVPSKLRSCARGNNAAAAVSNCHTVIFNVVRDIHLMGIKPLDSGLLSGEWM